MTKPTIADEVAGLLALIRAGRAWAGALAGIGEKHKYQASDALLLMPDVSEKNSDAFYAVCHYVESEPNEAFVARLLRLSELMARDCPHKLAFFVRRLIRSEKCYPLFRRAGRKATAPKRKVLLAVVAEYLKDLQAHPKPVFEERCIQLQTDLSK